MRQLNGKADVNVSKQNRIPDSGAAFFEMVAEPAI
jgi:hypothetical protein